VCPASVAHNWQREAQRFAPGLRVLVLESGKARKKLAEEEKQAAEKLRQDAQQAQAKRLDIVGAQAGYFGVVAARDKDFATEAALHEWYAEQLDAEARLATQMGNTADGYRLATQAINEHRAAQEALLGVTREALDIGGAYADYLDAIGQKAQAAQYRRETLAGIQAQAAREQFAAGNIAAGYGAAAAAERLARSAEEGGGAGMIGGLGGISGRQGALTDALRQAPAGYMGRVQVPQVVVSPNVNVRIGDEALHATKAGTEAYMTERAYYGTFAQ